MRVVSYLGYQAFEQKAVIGKENGYLYIIVLLFTLNMALFMSRSRGGILVSLRGHLLQNMHVRHNTPLTLILS